MTLLEKVQTKITGLINPKIESPQTTKASAESLQDNPKLKPTVNKDEEFCCGGCHEKSDN